MKKNKTQRVESKIKNQEEPKPEEPKPEEPKDEEPEDEDCDPRKCRYSRLLIRGFLSEPLQNSYLGVEIKCLQKQKWFKPYICEEYEIDIKIHMTDENYKTKDKHPT